MSRPYELDPDDPPQGIEVRLSYDCELCHGEGRIPLDPPPGSQSCVYCEFGKRETTVPLEVFAKLVAAVMPKGEANV